MFACLVHTHLGKELLQRAGKKILNSFRESISYGILIEGINFKDCTCLTQHNLTSHTHTHTHTHTPNTYTHTHKDLQY